jgi:hypothetical protein
MWLQYLLMIQLKIIFFTFNSMRFFNAMINTIISSVGDNPNLCGSDSCKKKKNILIY